MAVTERDLAASGIAIVPARDDHAEGLIQLIEPIFAEYEGVLFLMEEMPELRSIATTFEQHGGQFWCAFRDQQLIGSVGWTPATEGVGVELKKLYVVKAQRRHKLGHVLTSRVEVAGRAAGCGFVELWSDVKFDAAHRFYEARGYRRDGRTRELGDQSDTVEYYYRLDLDPAGRAEHD
ncbi:MAG: GNAT family N-acetyltransferase [Deltaproteobacteria bacterium]|nr:MAG: GNAT family N-acetyltransferase [Deltaproteobacteria bacterium]